MPKATKRRSIGHEESAKPLAKRQLAVAETGGEHVEVGSKAEASGNDILDGISESVDGKPLKKKEKQMLKHELFLKRLEDTRAPYSKSHERRMKKKAREQVAGGLTEMQDAIAALEAAEGSGSANPSAVGESDSPKETNLNPPKPNSAQIGEGKGATLTKAQRKRALQTERLRMPLIRSNPQFATNPFKTIRTHAQNTLVKHKTPESSS